MIIPSKLTKKIPILKLKVKILQKKLSKKIITLRLIVEILPRKLTYMEVDNEDSILEVYHDI